MKRLRDGERKVIRTSRMFSVYRNDRFKVEAERYDCDTPLIHLTCGLAESYELTLNEIEALELIDRLQRALSVLPSSK